MTTTKLSKTQAELLKKMQDSIDKARSVKTYEEYFEKYLGMYDGKVIDTPETFIKRMGRKFWDSRVRVWEEERKGIATVRTNSKTLKKLEEYGLVKILYDSTGEKWGHDKVEVIGY